MAPKKPAPKGPPKARNAEDGRYVPLDHAKKHPKTTVVERDRIKPKPKKKK